MSNPYRVGSKLALVAGCIALLTVPQTASAGRIRFAAHRPRYHHYSYYPYYLGNLARCPLHRTLQGVLVDCHGWRWRDTVGWDNTCFYLDYLPSQYTCSVLGAP